MKNKQRTCLQERVEVTELAPAVEAWGRGPFKEAAGHPFRTRG